MFVFETKHFQLSELCSAAGVCFFSKGWDFFPRMDWCQTWPVRQTSVLQLNHLPFPLSLHPIPTPHGAHTWPLQALIVFSNEHPVETLSGLKCKLFIGQWLSPPVVEEEWDKINQLPVKKVLFSTPLTLLDLWDNNVSTSLQINVTLCDKQRSLSGGPDRKLPKCILDLKTGTFCLLP